MDEFERKTDGSMAYPRKGTLNRLVYKTPLVLWRTGLGSLLSHPLLGGSRMLALTTRGRKSGQPRHTMLSYAPAGGKDYVCSGWGKRSDWVQNVLADPLVTVQVGRREYSARAYRVEDLEEFITVAEDMFLSGGDSHFGPWLDSHGIRYDREDMIAKRGRLMIFGFKPVQEAGPAHLTADLGWIWLLPAALILLILGAVVIF
jgi:deazaflavin-dependent oxidoreductase (nitroreductase family)